jgi:hypothetical protein
LEKLSPQREVCRDKKPSQKRKERMRRPLTNICVSGHNLVKSFLFLLNLHIYGVEKLKKHVGQNKQTNQNTTSKRMSTQFTDVDRGRARDFLLNISLTFNILPHFFRKLVCFHSGISTQKLISYRIQYGTFNLTK